MLIIWVYMPRNIGGINQSFGGTYCLQLQAFNRRLLLSDTNKHQSVSVVCNIAKHAHINTPFHFPFYQYEDCNIIGYWKLQ